MIEQYLIEHCSPTLASLKTANLVNIPFEDKAEIIESIINVNKQIKPKGVELILLKIQDSNALVYVCRKQKLERDLKKEGVPEFLNGRGYVSTDAEYCITHLKYSLINGDCFPHEIGLFLGYPLEDVVGFIENAGQNSRCTGCWKVYCNECEAMRIFARYSKCKTVYRKLWLQGSSLTKLTVAQ